MTRRQRQRRRAQRQEQHRLVAGLTFWYDGGAGICGGSWRAALRDHRLHVLRGGVDVAAQIELQRDVGAALRAGRVDRGRAPAIVANCFSSGSATADAIVSGLAPGRLALTWIVGKSTVGRSLTGSMRYAITPKTTMPSMMQRRRDRPLDEERGEIHDAAFGALAASTLIAAARHQPQLAVGHDGLAGVEPVADHGFGAGRRARP